MKKNSSSTQEALDAYSAALELKQETFGEKHRALSPTLYPLAICLTLSGR